ncbi:hypothetical protein ACWGJB_15835 [Streptomyces sp. NPDC054813]
MVLGACAVWPLLSAAGRDGRPEGVLLAVLAVVVLTAGAALTALAAVSAVGNALSFTTVSAGAGLLAGLATARPWVAGVPPS